MLEQQVDEGFVTRVPRHRVQQIGVLLTKHRIDEAAGPERERLPVERLGQHRRHDGAQRATGMLGLTQYRLEDRIVRVGDHQCCHLMELVRTRQALEWRER